MNDLAFLLIFRIILQSIRTDDIFTFKVFHELVCLFNNISFKSLVSCLERIIIVTVLWTLTFLISQAKFFQSLTQICVVLSNFSRFRMITLSDKRLKGRRFVLREASLSLRQSR